MLKMLQEWHWDRNRMQKIIFPCFFIPLPLCCRFGLWLQCYCLNSSLAFFSYVTAAALTLYHIKVIVLVYPRGQVKFMEQSRIMDREWQLWKVLHLISMTTKIWKPYSTPKQRAVTFKELDSEIPHCKVKKKGEEKINGMVWRARRQEPLIFIL